MNTKHPFFLRPYISTKVSEKCGQFRVLLVSFMRFWVGGDIFDCANPFTRNDGSLVGSKTQNSNIGDTESGDEKTRTKVNGSFAEVSKDLRRRD
jgi:hypothetical protein